MMKGGWARGVQVSGRSLPNLRLPDRACSVLDEACSQARVFLAEDEVGGELEAAGDDNDEVVMQQPVITPSMIAEVISQRTNIPVLAPGREERDRLLSLEALLTRRVSGQAAAISRV